jgi:hypothetical protein
LPDAPPAAAGPALVFGDSGRLVGLLVRIVLWAKASDSPAGAGDSARLFEDAREFVAVSRRGLARLTLE